MIRVFLCIAALASPAVTFGQSRVATPTFSVEGGKYSTVIMVVVQVRTPGATIRFTQNGIDPTPSDPAIASGSKLAINTSQILKARAFLAGRQPSDVRSATYTIDSAPLATIGIGGAAAGGGRSLLATPDGRVLAAVRRSAFIGVDGLSMIAAVAVGPRHAIALAHDGRVFAWGANGEGQLGDGTSTRRDHPVQVRGLRTVVGIAVGASHSVAVTADGRVWAWGENRDGQLGMVGPRHARVPTLIETLFDVARIDAGDSHSVAVTRSGDVYAWGANNQGQVGDGSRRDRADPVRIGLGDVSDVAAGATHTLAMTRNGMVYAWGSGSRGELGIDSAKRMSRPTPIADLRAYAVRAGRHFSSAIRHDGALMMWGANDAGQLGDGTVVDRFTPVQGPALHSISTLALGGRHSIAVTASGDVWTWGRGAAPVQTISDVGDWGPPIAPELLMTPAVEPASGSYPGPQTVTLTPNNRGVTLRYTLDGSDPTSESAVYTTPLLVSTSATVKARAYAPRDGVDPGPIASASFVIDMSPPSIVAELSLPGRVDWYTEPVTVTFQCADDSGSVACPPPVTVTDDGGSQLIGGTAVDPAGNQTSVAVTINMDRTPPSVILNSPTTNTSIADAQLLVMGRVVDAASGLADALRCNGEAVAVIRDEFECKVALKPGVNSITLQARDNAGHVTAAGLSITRVGESTTFAIAPDARTMLVNEVAPLTLRDEFGGSVSAALWSTSDPAVAMLSADDPPLVSAIAPGTATISATKDGRVAESTITVDAAGVLSAGTTRWHIAPAPGYAMQPPIFTHRVDPSVPDLFIVETQTWGEATLRAATADGEVLWRQESPGIPLMGDSFGGVIAGVLYDVNQGADFRSYVRLGDAGGVPPWRYDSAGALDRPAQGPDGTLYAIEYVFGVNANGDELSDKHVIVIDGKTGRVVSRQPLAREVDIFTAEFDGQVISLRPRRVCASTRFDNAPDTVGPIVGSDGRGYMLVRRLHKQKFDSCLEQHARPRRIIDVGVDLLILSPNNAPVFEPIFADACDVPAFAQATCDAPPSLYQLLPDGIGGMLAIWERFGMFWPNGLATLQRVVTRRDEEGRLIETPLERMTTIVNVGQAGTVYVSSPAGYSAIDATNWVPKWTANLDTYAPLAAHPDGGAAVYNHNGDMRVIGSDGNFTELPTVRLGLRSPIADGFSNWIGIKNGQLHVVAGTFPDATRFYPGAGNAQLQLSVRNPGIGIFLKSHWAFQGFALFKHLSIRIVPSDQAFWNAFDPAGFFPRDVYGNHFTTLGAGTGPEDTSVACSGTLTKGRNRDRDVLEDPSSLDAYPIPRGAEENKFIRSLVEGFDFYANNLPYACFPESNPGFFNSNSFARGLQDAVGLRAPRLRPGLFAPGWFTPVPRRYFRPN